MVLHRDLLAPAGIAARLIFIGNLNVYMLVVTFYLSHMSQEARRMKLIHNSCIPGAKICRGHLKKVLALKKILGVSLPPLPLSNKNKTGPGGVSLMIDEHDSRIIAASTLI